MSRKSLRNVVTYMYRTFPKKNSHFVLPLKHDIEKNIPHVDKIIHDVNKPIPSVEGIIQQPSKNNIVISSIVEQRNVDIDFQNVISEEIIKHIEYAKPIIEDRDKQVNTVNGSVENRMKNLDFLEPSIENRMKNLEFLEPSIEERFAWLIEEEPAPLYPDFFIYLPTTTEKSIDTYTGYFGYTEIIFDKVLDKDNVCLIISNLFMNTLILSDIGEIGINVVDTVSLQLFNSGNKGQSFSHQITLPTIFDDVLTPGYSSFNLVTIPNHSTISTSNDLCIGVYPVVTDRLDLGNYGSIGIKLVDKNNFEIYNTGLPYLPIRYFHVDDTDILIDHGTSQFAGVGNSINIVIPNSELIESKMDLCVLITPLVNSVSDLENIGCFGIEIVDKNNVKVYNTGTSTTYFKYIVVKKSDKFTKNVFI